MFSRTSILAAMALAAMRGSAILAAPRGEPPLPRNPQRRIRVGTSKYMPHQGKREIARRLRQAERLAQKGN